MSKRPLGYWTHPKPLSTKRQAVLDRARREVRRLRKIRQLMAEYQAKGKT